ncbi:uncharacterized protein [Nicotiana sylvestris]|uniref:uncharacterized protein n=1 Tax=Nicotiana sylvestris TaxID=4096 RepID=UPI00388C3E02
MTFLTLYSFYLQKKNFKNLVLSHEWKDNRYAKEYAEKETAKVLISPSFWNNVVRALKFGGPLIRVLRMVDGERKPPMGYLYEVMDRAKETIAASFEGDVRKYEIFFEIIDNRWTDQLHRPLHAAGHLLNPGLFYKNTRDDTLALEVWIGYHEFLEKLVPNLATVDQIGAEFGRYSQVDGLFGIQATIRTRDIRSPDEQVYEGNDLDWGSISMAAGVEENIYGLRGSSSSSNYKGKGLSSSSRSLIDEDSENEEYDSQYNANILEVVEFKNLKEE